MPRYTVDLPEDEKYIKPKPVKPDKPVKHDNGHIKQSSAGSQTKAVPKEKYIDMEERTHKKKIGLFIFVILLVLLGMIAYKGFKSSNDAVNKTEKLKDGEVLMPSVAGYDVESAIEFLKNCELEPNIIYTYDPYYLYDTVIKTDISSNTVINKGDKVLVYVCRTAEVSQNVEVSAEKTPYEKDYIEVINTEIQGDQFSISVKNCSEVDIKEIAYTVIYKDSAGIRLGERTYFKTGLDFKRNSVIELHNKIKAPADCVLSISRFSCKTTDK